jgi:hypothetical protein
MGKEKAAKPKSVKVGGVKLSSTSAKEGGAFNPAIEETDTTTSSTAVNATPSEEGSPPPYINAH